MTRSFVLVLHIRIIDAPALSHGGRVNIHIPPLTDGQTGNELPEWLGIRSGGDPAGKHVSKRGFGTHDVEIREGADGSEEMIEKGGAGANFRHLFNKDSYGMNPSLAGSASAITMAT